MRSSSPSLFFLSLSNISFPSVYFSEHCYRWPVDTFISVELLTGWVWHGLGCHGPLLNLFGNLSWTAQNLVTWFPYIAIWWINSKVPEGSMITSENGSVARESSSVIILKSRLNSTGHSTCTSKDRDIFDRQTHVPNDWWQLMCSLILQPWDCCNSMMAPVRNITSLINTFWVPLLFSLRRILSIIPRRLSRSLYSRNCCIVCFLVGFFFVLLRSSFFLLCLLLLFL